jgi:hypothetical protein
MCATHRLITRAPLEVYCLHSHKVYLRVNILFIGRRLCFLDKKLLARHKQFHVKTALLALQFAAIFYFLICFVPQASAAQPSEQSKRYFALDNSQILINPGVGLANFNHSHTKNTQRPTGKTAYYRFYWNDIENENSGVYDFSEIDKALALARNANEAFGFRIMSAKPKDADGKNYIKIPLALIHEGSRDPVPVGFLMDNNFIPNYNSPRVIESARALLQALGKRYANHPNLYFIDVGLVGFWGEWHLGGSADGALPNETHAKKYVDMHLDNFPGIPALMLIGNGNATSIKTLEYAANKMGTGWRVDGWGDYRFLDVLYDTHTIKYPSILNQVPRLQDSWLAAPVALEAFHSISKIIKENSYTTKGSERKFVSQAEHIDKSFEFAITHHASLINTAPNDTDFIHLDKALLERYKTTLAQLGYRFFLSQSSVKYDQLNHSAWVSTTWNNLGNAPSYGKFKLAFRLRREQGALLHTQVDANSTVDNWLPGNRAYTQTTQLKTLGFTGKLFIDCAVLTKFSYPIRLANKESRADHWVEIGQFESK